MAKRLEDMTVAEARAAGRYDEYMNIVNQYPGGSRSTPINDVGSGNYGAGGDRGDLSVFANTPSSTITRNEGESNSSYAKRIKNQEFEMAGEVPGGGGYGSFVKAPAPGLSPTAAAALAKQYGLTGISKLDFTGMSRSEATKKAQAEQQKYKAQTSALTSYTYNPETISNSKKAVDDFLLSLNKINVEPWTQNGTKQDAIRTQLAVTASELAKNWTDSNSFLRDFNSNPDIQKNLQAFVNAGGTKEQIAQNIEKNSMDYAPTDRMQTTDEYLANMSPADKALRQKAVDELIPEMNLAQDEIARNFGIADDLKKLYFGTPEQVGIFERKIIEAQEANRILEEREKDAKTELREKANLKIEMEENQLKLDLAKNEKNRLAAKNYMTGMLAKMGALNTTSAGVQAITELDLKYQQAEQKLESDARYRIKATGIDLAADINEVENKTDEQILKIREDLTKDSETIAKEIMKAEQNANKEMYNITSKYAALIRTQTDKYRKESKTAAEKYAKDYAYTASGGMSLSDLSNSIGLGNVGEGEYVVAGKQKGVVGPDGEIIPMNLTPTQIQQVQNGKINGVEGIQYFLALPTAFRNEWIQVVAGTEEVYEISRIKKAYEAWQKEQETKKKTTSSKTTTSDREI